MGYTGAVRRHSQRLALVKRKRPATLVPRIAWPLLGLCAGLVGVVGVNQGSVALMGVAALIVLAGLGLMLGQQMVADPIVHQPGKRKPKPDAAASAATPEDDHDAAHTGAPAKPTARRWHP